MALQVFDGFEIAPVIRNSMSGTTITAQTGRDGVGKGFSCLSGAELQCPLPTAAATVIVGVGWKPNASAYGDTVAGAYCVTIRGDAGATQHLSVNVSADGHVYLRRGNAAGTIIATSTLILTAGVWHYVEVKATISDTVGICIVKIDGVEWINFTGDTKNGGTLTTVSTVGLGDFSDSIYDDFYILDGTGAAPYNDFIGERVIRAGRPDGAGASTALTPSAGANYQCVDEDPWTTTDYVSGTAGTDLYTHSDVSGFSSVDAVQVVTYAAKTDAGVRTLRTVMRSNLGTSVESADLPLTTTVAVVQGPIRQTDPDAATLTQTLVNTAQYGVKVV